MSRLIVRMNLAKTVLKELSKQPLRRTEIEMRVIKKPVSHGTFVNIFSYLVENGYLQKKEQKLRSSFELTEKGRKLLEAL